MKHLNQHANLLVQKSKCKITTLKITKINMSNEQVHIHLLYIVLVANKYITIVIKLLQMFSIIQCWEGKKTCEISYVFFLVGKLK